MSTAVKRGWSEMLEDSISYNRSLLEKMGLSTDPKKKGITAKKIFSWARQQGGQKEDCFYMFKEEGEKDLMLIEFFNADGYPLIPRKTYKWIGSPTAFTSEHEEGQYGFRVYMDELIEVKPEAGMLAPWIDPVNEPEVSSVIRFDKMTANDFLAVFHGVPCADHESINRKIREIKSAA
jgi:hypothetical protein